MQPIYSFLAGVLVVVSFIPYLSSIIRGKTKPARASWIVWCLLDIVTLASMYVENAVNSQMMVSTIGSIMVLMLSIRYGKPGWTKLDIACLMSAVVGIALWPIFQNAILTMMLCLSIIVIGSLPTIASVWEDPTRENRLSWMLQCVSCIFALLAISEWRLATAAQPLTFLLIGITVTTFIITRNIFNSFDGAMNSVDL